MRLWLLVVLVMLCLASPAAAKLSGDLEMVYTDYSTEDDGEKVKSLSSFSQKYSVYYDTNGFVGDQRLGSWDIGLGYEWASNSTTIDSEYSIDSENPIDDESSDTEGGKILFRGRVSIAPGALPFRFNAFSFDDSPTSYTYAGTGELLDTTFIVGSRDREVVRSGMNLRAGIRNGSYLGQYRKLLSKFPRVFIDYRQIYIRDKGGLLFEEHSLGRDLAFVSLNKKDNWFHYRAYDYQDYDDSKNDYSTQTFILGTIDQSLKRRWIDMTNWIQLSVDGTYAEEETEDRIVYNADPKTFSLNFFTAADRGKTRISNFSSFRRTKDSDMLSKDVEIPFYANGWIDPNRSWSMQLRSYSYTEDWFDQEKTQEKSFDEDGQYFAGRLGFGHNSRLKFDSTLEIERGKNSPIEAYTVRARNEIGSNVNVRAKNPWLLGHTVYYSRFTGNDGDIGGIDSSGLKDIYENELYGSYVWAMSPRNSLELRQGFRHQNALLGNGTRYISGPKGYAKSFITKVPGQSSDDLYVSETSLSLESRLKANLTNRVTFVSNLYRGGEGDVDDFSIVDKLVYRSNRWRIDMTNGFYAGDDPPSPTSGGNIIIPTTKRKGFRPNPTVDYMLGHRSLFEYYPNRQFKTKAIFDFTIRDTDIGTIYRTLLQQSSEYTFLSRSGRRRALARVYQALEYENYSTDSDNADYLEFSLGTSYYPFATLELGGEMVYKAWEPQGISALRFTTMAVLTYSKFACEARYSYGVGQLSDGLIDERKEHLFEAKVRKSF